MEEEKKPVKTNGKRNRYAGHSFERAVAELLRSIGFVHTITSRQGSRSRDNEGIDLMNNNETKNGRLPYNFSCKNTTAYPRYSVLLKNMPEGEGINVVLHNFTSRKPKGGFYTAGKYAILNMEDFMKMIQRIHELEKQMKDDSSY